MSEQPQPQPDKAAQPQPQQQENNVTKQLAEAQKELLEYDKESVQLTQQKYHAYLGMINASQKDPDIKNAEGKTAAQLKEEWKKATQARTEGRKAIEQKINQILDPSILEKDEERKERLAAIQKQSESACLEKSKPNLAKFKKENIEKAIDQAGGPATQEFKEVSKFKQ